MCGICGLVNLDGAPAEPALVGAMSDRLAHRGPDGSGMHTAGAAALGHRRLAIVDIDGGAQPMLADEVALVANAEIFNHLDLRRELEGRGHRFATRCDSEAILHGYREWGPAVVERLEGMFAFAIWDAPQHRLVLARDRFGQKPLYYARDGERLLFASEAKSILAARAEAPAVEPEALARYLLLDYLPSPWSIYRGIRRLPAAHVLIAEAGALRIERYWRLPPAAGSADMDRACRDVREAFANAVRKRLMSDQPVGIFLSGGNDSALVLREAARSAPEAPPDSFTIAFDDREGGFDESDRARRQALAAGSRHHVQRFAARDLAAELDGVVDHLDEPFADPAVLPTYVLSRFAAQHVKVVLGGDGADELFAGYDSFAADRIDALTASFDAVKRTVCAALAAVWPASEMHFGTDFRLRQAARALAEDPAVRPLAWTMTHTPEEIRRLFRGAPSGDLFSVARDIEGADRVDRALRILAATYLEGDILPKLDRAGMAHGLEVRSPFLDHRLAEIVAALPASFKLRRLQRKWLLRRAFADRAWVAKHGFWVPVARWINGELAAWFDDLLLDPASYRDGLIDRGEVEKLLRRHRRGGVNLRKPLWNLAMLFAWKRRWL